jgi:lipopolysaccharide export system protein LptC
VLLCKRNIVLFTAVLITGTALLSSCDKKHAVINDLQIKDLPSLSARDVETMYSDSGKVTLVVRSPLIQQFTSKDDPHTIFPQGLTVLFYDKASSPQASITSRYAKYTEKG